MLKTKKNFLSGSSDNAPDARSDELPLQLSSKFLELDPSKSYHEQEMEKMKMIEDRLAKLEQWCGQMSVNIALQL